MAGATTTLDRRESARAAAGPGTIILEPTKDVRVDHLEGDPRGELDLMIEQAGLATQVGRVGDRFDDAAGRLL